MTKKSLRKRGDKTDDYPSLSQLKLQDITFKPENVWDLPAIHSFLETICRRTTESFELRKQPTFCIYILNVTRDKVQSMCSAPEYKQIKYSKSSFKHLAEMTAFVLKYFVQDLPEAMDDDEISVSTAAIDCFLVCLKTATALYQRKFEKEFLKYLRKLHRLMGFIRKLPILRDNEV